MLSFLSRLPRFKEVFGKLKKFPSGKQCLEFFRFLTPKEKKWFAAFSFLALTSFSFLSASLYRKSTSLQPAPGGEFTEGAVGQPRFINPVLAPASDIDRDLTQLIYAGLMKYSGSGQIVPELAQEYRTEEKGKVWAITLKKNLVFEDGSPLKASDVVFTVKTIQNPDYKSPLRPAWLGVEAEAVSDLEVRFKLKNAYPAFLENLTLKILSQKTWQEVQPENFALTSLNLKPVGSGPYRLTKISTDTEGKGLIKSLVLEINPLSVSPAKIRKINFVFFESEKELSQAVKNGTVQNFVVAETLSDSTNLKVEKFQLPRYFAVFFNLKSSAAVSQKDVRKALSYAVDKKEIIDNILAGKAEKIDSPLLNSLYGFNAPKNTFEFNPGQAKTLLEKAGFKLNAETQIYEKPVSNKSTFRFKSRLSQGSSGTEVKELQKCLARDPALYPEGEVTGSFGQKTKEALKRFQEKYRQEILVPAGLEAGNGEAGELTRKKLNEVCTNSTEQSTKLKFNLLTVDDPVLLKVAQELKNQWQAVGVQVEVKSYNFTQLNSEFLRPRNYDALLFGEALGQIPDLFPFWHSLQKKDPGLNLSGFENSEADKLLVEARQTDDEKTRKEKYEKFQDILLAEAPAVFLYRPYFLYSVQKNIKGVAPGFIADPSQRFAGIQEWYIKSKRVWK